MGAIPTATKVKIYPILKEHKMSDDDERTQEIKDQGGVVIEESDDTIRVLLAVDPKNPEQIFDRLNEIEVDLIKQALSDYKKIEKISEFIDSVREVARKKLKMLENDDDDKLSPNSSMD